MPKFNEPIIPLGDDSAIGVVTRGNNGFWYIRLLHRDRNEVYYKSTKVRYEGTKKDQLEASKIGNKIYREWFLPKVERGQTPTESNPPNKIARRYLMEIIDKVEKNEALIRKGKAPLHEVDYGVGLWTRKRYEDAERLLLGAVHDYFQEKGFTEISNIRENELQDFRKWAQTHYEWSPSRINKALTQIRHLWRFAYDKAYVDYIPTIKKASPDLQQRKRRQITEDEQRLIFTNAQKIHRDLIDAKASDKRIYKAFQFVAWLMLLANSGIRPPSGQEDRLLIRWKDIVVREKHGDELRYLKRHGEKKHLDYEALILPNTYIYLDELRKIYAKEGIEAEYVFTHTHNARGGCVKGEPIKSFKRRWQENLKDVGLDSPVGTPQSEKLVPYSLRAFFITQRMKLSDIRGFDLARATGTSDDMIHKTYYGYQTHDIADTLLEGVLDRRAKTPIYKNGHYIGRG